MLFNSLKSRKYLNFISAVIFMFFPIPPKEWPTHYTLPGVTKHNYIQLRGLRHSSKDKSYKL